MAELPPDLPATQLMPSSPRAVSSDEPLAGSLAMDEPRFPETGELLGEYQLIAELGRGAIGRVFLAAQVALADRPVVLKLTPRTGREHLSLARLQHTGIVPLYAVHDDVVRNLRVLCMPYFGGTSLAHLVHALRTCPPAERTGQHLLDALEQVQAAAPVHLPGRGPARQVLARATWVETVCRVGALLADALQYAHERGLLHLDIKPGNVLIAADATPMLLDFHLAREPLGVNSPAPEWLGGTVAYMSHEQQAALAAVHARRPLTAALDARADLYSLGVMLYEALGGPHPYLPKVSPPLHRCNPRVSIGLSDVIQRCAAYEARQRYPDAASLAADLRRHLTDQPLQGVPNRSLVEQWHKWRRRRPYAWVLGAVVLAGAAVATVAVEHLRQQTALAHADLLAGQLLLQQRRPAEAEVALRRGLTLAVSVPWAGALVDELRGQLDQASTAEVELLREQAAVELHTLADRVRPLYGLGLQPTPVLRGLADRCRALWERRSEIRALLPRTALVDNDLLDLAVCWSDLQVQLSEATGEATVRRQALRVLAEAEQLYGASPIICQERSEHAAALRDSTIACATAPAARTPWEHYAVGRTLLRAGNLSKAEEELKQALRDEPHGFWPNFALGMCLYRAGRHPDAVTAFSVCIGASPMSAASFANRSLCYAALGRIEEARLDHERARHLDAALTQALRTEPIRAHR